MVWALFISFLTRFFSVLLPYSSSTRVHLPAFLHFESWRRTRPTSPPHSPFVKSFTIFFPLRGVDADLHDRGFVTRTPLPGGLSQPRLTTFFPLPISFARLFAGNPLLDTRPCLRLLTAL